MGVESIACKAQQAVMSWSKLWDRSGQQLEHSQQCFTYILVLFLWLIIQLTIFHYLGIRTGSDTQLYVDAAHNLLDGEWPQGRMIWYTTYIAFLALVFALNGSFPLIVFLQVLLSGVAAVGLWFSVKRITESFWTSFVAVSLYLCWFKIHQWNTFIYTESLFTSLAIITFAVLLSLKRPYHYILFAILFLLTFFVRPTGFCLMIGLILYVMQKVRWNYRMKFAIGMIFLLTCLLLLNNMLTQFTLVESYAKGEIIYPNIRLDVEIPNDLMIPNPSLSPLTRLGMFGFYNPFFFIKITLLKLFLFLANVKPYFSLLHNLLIALILYPLYIFAFLGFRHFPGKSYGNYVILGFILAQSLTVMLTTENWDGRFLIPILPFVFILSAIGIKWMIKRI